MRSTLLVRLYPQRWRERYGEEFDALLHELPVTPRLLFDVLASALGARLADLVRSARPARFAGGPTIDLQSPGGSALIALALMLPTIALLGTFALKFKLGIDGPFETYWIIAGDRLRALGYVLVLVPWLSLVLAVRPLVRVSLRRTERGVSVDIAGRMHAWNLAVALVSASVIYLLFRYFIDQNMVAPPWGWGSPPWPWFPPPWG